MNMRMVINFDEGKSIKVENNDDGMIEMEHCDMKMIMNKIHAEEFIWELEECLGLENREGLKEQLEDALEELSGFKSAAKTILGQ